VLWTYKVQDVNRIFFKKWWQSKKNKNKLQDDQSTFSNILIVMTKRLGYNQIWKHRDLRLVFLKEND
jgi:hypothetical protein